jgi:hypothetical protein
MRHWFSLLLTIAVIPALVGFAAPAVAAIDIDLSYVDQQSPQFQRFKSYVDRAVAGHPDYGFSATDAAYLYRMTGDSQYAIFAVEKVDEQVSAAESDIAAGRNPEVAGDSYLDVGPMIGDLALAYDWCGAFATSSQRSRWSAYAEQAIFNVWNPQQAEWGGRSAPWSGWAIDDPGDNYFYSFIQATMFWALASDSATWRNFLNTVKLPELTDYFEPIDGGSQEGTGYGLSHKRLFDIYRVWRDSTGADVGNQTQHMTDSIYWWLYATVPTLDRTAAIGDQARVSEPVVYDYHRTLMLEARKSTDDPAARDVATWWLRNISLQQMQSSFNYLYDLLPAGTGGVTPPSLFYHAQATGHLFARTSWNTDATWMEFDAGPYVQSHAHQDQGSFTLYRNGWLAVTENIWSHSGIQQGTNVHNILRFERNGQIVPQRVGTYSTMTVTPGAGGSVHAVGNLTPAYGGNSAVQSWQRTIDFDGGMLTVQDDYAVGSGTQATFQVNVPERPSISGNTATAGDLRITVLSPAGATLQAVDWTTVDSDFNSGWRVDVAGGNGRYVVQLSADSMTGDALFNDGFD